MNLSKLWEIIEDRGASTLSQRVRYDLVTEQQQSYVTLGKFLLCVFAYCSVERASYSACLLRFLQKLIGLKCAKQSANCMI